jgi:hypothetical protein
VQNIKESGNKASNLSAGFMISSTYKIEKNANGSCLTLSK